MFVSRGLYFVEAPVVLTPEDSNMVIAAYPGSKPVLIAQLEPGGKGDVLQMNHGTDVFEAIGDFS